MRPDNPEDSPLWNAIKRLKRAMRARADGRMIKRLQDRVDEEAAKVAAQLPPGCQSVEEVIRGWGKDQGPG